MILINNHANSCAHLLSSIGKHGRFWQDWEWGIGDWAWGIGHGAWGMGHGELGVGDLTGSACPLQFLVKTTIIPLQTNPIPAEATPKLCLRLHFSDAIKHLICPMTCLRRLMP
ncbi:hypothetical protein [Microcoleus sp. FACHB-68]|uniref:hypothetical protein n=1 Tax=Microcoleus sp. FACHB-68 TaxID=2692826 RepID=UPI00168981CC|nr:hypothetical protein [Microcoleus sp. FACHB-68]MBD1937923.1 hypothetical protein [Microcoleus sp. FACHB-68]